MSSETAQQAMTGYQELLLAEAVTYRPKGAAANDRPIQALVTRSGPDPYLAPGNAVRIVLTVLDDAVLGITPSEIDTGADVIVVAERKGGTPGARGLHRVLEQDGDFVTVEVR